MQSRGSSQRLPSMALHRTPISYAMFAMFAVIASVYVAGCLWQDAERRVLLIKELDQITGKGQRAISVNDTLKVAACRDQQKKLVELEMELEEARHKGFKSRYANGKRGKQLSVVVGITTGFGRRKQRDAVRKAWFQSGAALKKLEDQGILVRFVIGRSANRGDSMDRAIDVENKETRDIIVLDNHIEAPEELPKKMKLFFIHAVDTWDAEFYAKVNDDIYVNIDALGAVLAAHKEKTHAYIGCMKSGEVFSDKNHKWYEPEWWKFGDAKSYFRHASGDMFIISRALAQFISINRSILRTYAHDDVSAGSWLIGLDVNHVNEKKLCCSSWPSEAICQAA